jgi:hypothetical protein
VNGFLLEISGHALQVFSAEAGAEYLITEALTIQVQVNKSLISFALPDPTESADPADPTESAEPAAK